MKEINIYGANRFPEYTKTRVACRGIIAKDGHVLAVHLSSDDIYSTPGGEHEGNESLNDCVRREVEEETGYIVEPRECVALVNEYYEEYRYITYYYVCEVVGVGEKHLTESEAGRGLEVIWLPFDRLYGILSHYDDFADSYEEKRGMYEREYAALGEYKKEYMKMDFAELSKITDESERVRKTYEIFNEDTRLTHSKAARVEFITTVRYIEKYLHAGAKILDIGAGAGEYSIFFARRGYDVSAIELSPQNIEYFRAKLTPDDKIDLHEGNALDLSRYDDGTFDSVLLLGPLYHLGKREDQLKAIAEAKRVCKQDGVIYFAFITNDFVHLTELGYNPNHFISGEYNKETFRLDDFPFVFHTVDECRELLADGGIIILHEIAADGVSELLADRINALDDESYAQYLRYHEYICEKKEFLGMTNHLLFVGR